MKQITTDILQKLYINLGIQLTLTVYDKVMKSSKPLPITMHVYKSTYNFSLERNIFLMCVCVYPHK